MHPVEREAEAGSARPRGGGRGAGIPRGQSPLVKGPGGEKLRQGAGREGRHRGKAEGPGRVDHSGRRVLAWTEAPHPSAVTETQVPVPMNNPCARPRPPPARQPAAHKRPPAAQLRLKAVIKTACRTR